MYLKKGVGAITEQDIIDHCCAGIAHFKVPRMMIFDELPKTSIGKVQRFRLRQKAENETAQAWHAVRIFQRSKRSKGLTLTFDIETITNSQH